MVLSFFTLPGCLYATELVISPGELQSRVSTYRASHCRRRLAMADLLQKLLPDILPRSWLFLLCPLFLVSVHYWFTRKFSAKRQRLPPSPPALPIIGHLHLIGSLPHVSLRGLARKHGPRRDAPSSGRRTKPRCILLARRRGGAAHPRPRLRVTAPLCHLPHHVWLV